MLKQVQHDKMFLR